jgi:small subunit ribosomal protein S20
VPHHKSAKKRMKTSEERRQRNAANQSRMRHAVRDLKSALQGGKADAEATLQVATLLDRMAQKGLVHRNKAARLKSRLSQAARKTS